MMRMNRLSLRIALELVGGICLGALFWRWRGELLREQVLGGLAQSLGIVVGYCLARYRNRA